MSENLVLGIGGVHYHAISQLLKKERFTVNDLSKAIETRLDKTDAELGGGEYVDTMVTNLILVKGLMDYLKVKEIKALKVNLTEGLVNSKTYWP